MRVLHINATSHTGGAARAMGRLHSALVKKGHQSQFLVGRSKFVEDPIVHLIWDEVSRYRSLGGSLLSRIGNQFEKYLGIHPWSNRSTLKITETSLFNWADIIDLRNLFGGFLNLWSLPPMTTLKPVVWRMPDLWAVTGHCAYPYDCQRWITGCYQCPLLTPEGRKIIEPNPTIWDGTRRVWRAKKDLYQKSNLHIIVTTEWMRRQVKQSILGDALSINVISNGVDLEIYKPRDKAEARKKLGLPEKGPVLMWSAGSRGNYRKGYHLLEKALERMQADRETMPLLITMGGAKGWDQPERLQNVKHLGYVRDPEQQSLVYAASDVFLCPTLADGQPQTALESLACGIPIIAFDLGPMPDLAINGKTGFLVPDQTAENLQSVIVDFLGRIDDFAGFSENCRREALKKYDLQKQTEKYIELYEAILADRL
jgi:glycosyltransferase involved in cell wall biosynthesis